MQIYKPRITLFHKDVRAGYNKNDRTNKEIYIYFSFNVKYYIGIGEQLFIIRSGCKYKALPSEYI